MQKNSCFSLNALTGHTQRRKGAKSAKREMKREENEKEDLTPRHKDIKKKRRKARKMTIIEK